MKLSVINIRDMLSADQEELVRAYLETYSCETEMNGVKKTLNPDIERKDKNSRSSVKGSVSVTASAIFSI